KLEALATTDGLTGLKNHRAFQEYLEQEFERAARYGLPLSLAMLDVDHFKQYNDTYGHPAGDEVLKTLAELLQDKIRLTDFVARYGGEEFVIVLPNTGGTAAREAIERVRAAIEGLPWLGRGVTVSVGISSINPQTQ